MGGGANTKKHILSPVETRLSLFANCVLDRATEKVTESFRLSNSHLSTRSRHDKAGESKSMKKFYNSDGSLKTTDQIIDLNNISLSDPISSDETVEVTANINKEMTDQENVKIELNNLENSSNLEASSIAGIRPSDLDKENLNIDREADSNINPSSNYLKKNSTGQGTQSRDGISFEKREYHTACFPSMRSSGNISSTKGASLLFSGAKHRDNTQSKNKSTFLLRSAPLYVVSRQAGSAGSLVHQSRSKSSTASNRQERSDSTSGQLIESRGVSTKINKQSALSFLESLEEVVKNSQSDPEKAQWNIEKLSIESEKNKLEDLNYFLTRHSHGFHKLVLEANTTLNILYEKKELKLKFPSLDKELNKLEYLLLTFSLGITYYGRLD